jgi:hypothetical protein
MRVLGQRSCPLAPRKMNSALPLVEDRWVSELHFQELTVQPPTGNESTDHPEIRHPKVCVDESHLACSSVDHPNQYKNHQCTDTAGDPECGSTFSTRQKTLALYALGRRLIRVLVWGLASLSARRLVSILIRGPVPAFLSVVRGVRSVLARSPPLLTLARLTVCVLIRSHIHSCSPPMIIVMPYQRTKPSNSLAARKRRPGRSFVSLDVSCGFVRNLTDSFSGDPSEFIA